MTTKYVQGKRAVLQGSINDSATTCTLTGFLDLSGNPIVQADIGETGYGTFEPNTDREEAVSFTIDSNVAGVAVLTLTRGLLGKAPYGAGGTSWAHNSGTEFVMSNNPSLFNKMTAKDNDEVVTGNWEFPAPVADQSPATKLYVDEIVNGGTVSINRTVVAATAGGTIIFGDLVYFDETDTEWKKTAGATDATLNNVKLGIAQGAGFDGGAIAGGVLIQGLDSTQTGMTPGAKQYAGDTSGTIVETPGTIERCIGIAKSATELYFDPIFSVLLTSDKKDALAGGGNFGTPGSGNKFATETYTSSRLPNRIVYDLADSPAIWTKPEGLSHIFVEAWGGGGSGNTAKNSTSVDEGWGGGGGAAHVQKYFSADELSATITVTVGAGGPASVTSTPSSSIPGSGGTSSTFGALLTALPGAGGNGREGGNGGAVQGFDFGTGGLTTELASKNAIFGGAGGGRGSSSGAMSSAGNSIYGGGGGGPCADVVTTQAGGTSLHGGNGGNGVGVTSGAATAGAGAVPGGGGGAAFTSESGGTVATSGAGGAGRVIITEYFL